MTTRLDIVKRMQKHGPGALAPIELLALIIEDQPDKRDLLVRCRDMLSRMGGIRKLADVAPADLEAYGIPSQGASRILAAIELGRRVFQAGLGERTVIRGPEDVAQEFAYLRDEKREHFCAILLDAKGHLLRSREISVGALDSTVVHPREVFREALREGAASVIVAHNHPSGDPEPSDEDIVITRRLAEAGRLLGVELLDHVILGENSYVSLHERGVL